MNILYLDNWHTLSYRGELFKGILKFIEHQAKSMTCVVVTSGDKKSTLEVLAPIDAKLDRYFCQEDMPTGKTLEKCVSIYGPEGLMIGNTHDIDTVRTAPQIPLIIVRDDMWATRPRAEILITALKASSFDELFGPNEGNAKKRITIEGEPFTFIKDPSGARIIEEHPDY